MSDIAIGFFDPDDVLGLSGDGWVQQENNIATTHQRAQGLSAIGDEAAKHVHGELASGSVVYECHAETGNLTLPNAGAVLGASEGVDGYLVDNCQLVYSPTGYPRLTLNVHQHGENPHADEDMRQFTPSLTCPAQYGVPRTLGISNLGDVCGVRGCTYTWGVTHVDEDENGDHLAGQSRDGVETLAYEFTGHDHGEGDTPAFADPSGWDEMNDGATKGNTAADTSSLAWEKHAATAIPEVEE